MSSKLNDVANWFGNLVKQPKKKRTLEEEMEDESDEAVKRKANSFTMDQVDRAARAEKSINKAMNMEKPSK